MQALLMRWAIGLTVLTLVAGCGGGTPAPSATTAPAGAKPTTAAAAASPSPAAAASPAASPAAGASPSPAASPAAAASPATAASPVAAASPAVAASPAATSAPVAAAPCTTPVRFTVRLNFVLDAEQVPYFTALDKGWYREQCLEPEFQAGTGSTNTVQLVGNGSADMGIADTVAIMLGQGQGVPLQAFGVVYQHNPSAFLIRQESLTPEQQSAQRLDPQVLYDKTYGAVIAGSPFIFYKAFVKQQNLDTSRIRQVNISPPGFTEMVTKQVDFIVTFFTVAPVLSGRDVPLKVFRLEDYGQRAYGLSYFSLRPWVEANGDTITKFLQVTKRAIEYTNDNPEEGVQFLCRYNSSVCADDRAFQTNVEEQKLQIPLYDNVIPGKPYFCADPATWRATAQLLVDAETIPALPPDLDNSFTNKYVQGC